MAAKALAWLLSGILHQKLAEMPMSAFTAQINALLTKVRTVADMEPDDALTALEDLEDPIFEAVS